MSSKLPLGFCNDRRLSSTSCLAGRPPMAWSIGWPGVCHGAHFGEGPVRAMADALSGRDGKAGALVEPKSGFGDDAAQTMVSLSGLSVTAATGVQSRVWPLQRRGLAWRARL